MINHTWQRADTDWFAAAKWGVFTHYLAPPEMTAEAWQRQVDAFDLDGFVRQIAAVGAPYCFMTIGQNSGHYCSPNAVYDEIVGITPSKLSRRDLIAELSTALGARGISLLVYLPSGAPLLDRVAMDRLEWEWGYQGEWPNVHSGPTTGKRLESFQRKWEAIIREWSLRWGAGVRGWWIDGCYFADDMYRFPEPPNFRSFTEGLKAGNPESLVAYNPGVNTPVISMTEYEDYTAGEISLEFPACPGGWVDGARYQILSYLGEAWGAGEPRFRDEFVTGYTLDVTSKGGVVTWDVPIQPDGSIPAPFLRQLGVLGEAMRR